MNFCYFGFRGRLTSATSEGAQGIFSKIAFLKSVRSNKKNEVCHGFLVNIFTKSLHRGGVKHHYFPNSLWPETKTKSIFLWTRDSQCQNSADSLAKNTPI